MTITSIPSPLPGSGNTGIVPPWLLTAMPTHPHTARAQATTWNPMPVEQLDDMPRMIEPPIHTWPYSDAGIECPRVV